MLTVAIILVGALVAACSGEVEQHIVGGSNANYGDHPYICSLQRNNNHICGSVIWNNNYVITAAHCVDGGTAASSLRVVCGLHRISNTDSNQVVHFVSSITLHESWNPNGSGFPNDVAVLRLSSALSFNTYVNKANAATSSSGDFAGQTCTLSGWGRLSGGGATPNTLQKVDMTALSHTQCRSYWTQVNVGHICFLRGTGFSACNGDSGGPVRCGNTLTGVTSWGASTCSGSLPSVYTRISYYYNWIVSKAGSN